MVSRGMNVGEIFIDGGLSYKVLKVNSDGSYISKRVEASEIPEEKPEAKPVEKPARKTRRTKGEG